MRRSGESRAPGENESPDTNDARGQEAPAGEAQPRPPHHYSVWLKVDKPKRRVTEPPPHLSQRTWTRLTRQIAAYLRTRLNNNVTLRSLVRVAASEMRLAGARPDEVAAAMRRAVREHPELTMLDRTNVVTRRLASEELLDLMLEWAQAIERPNHPDSA